MFKFVSFLFLSHVSAAHPRGHLQTLGSHQPSEGHIDVLDGSNELPRPRDFYYQYVLPQRPVVIRHAIMSTPPLTTWTDKYLSEQYGDVEIGIETLKKEDRNQPGKVITLREFLQKYQSEEIYMVDSLPKQLQKEWMVPRFLLCGGYTENIHTLYTWLSSGGTSSVLHVDMFENLHCVVHGSKKFVIIDHQYLESIRMDNKESGYFEMDVDRVDLEKFPGLVGVPWYEATVYRGDCLYLPFMWLHQVRSYAGDENKNMAVNLWWHPFKFNESDCIKRPNIPQFLSFDHFTPRPALSIKTILKQTAQTDGYIYLSDFKDLVKERMSNLPEEVVNQLFQYVDVGNEGRASAEYLDTLNYSVFEQMMQIVTESEQNSMNDENTDETTDIDDEHPDTQKDEL
ncbi:bifunctional peptidase and arginyl-hydroxylase JMJD5-like [Corticium candelabrum]|uniref:bifunctional peptidase and arginyl-hydroxylase JMJD5-like n=1 Tax=Corticium candelabrum TaxID=121492 RepID=UPI002E2722D5|nr:bifunctional peptidase and arginyl-hydroxylase JMJD5-like [Corticium candelabrum]